MSDLNIRLAAVDMAGTTVADDGLVLAAFDAAARAVGLPMDGADHAQAQQYVVDAMGQSKIVVFRHLLQGDETLARQANSAFEEAYARAVSDGGVQEVDGAADTIESLRNAGVKVALTTGFSAATQQRLLVALGWEDLADIAIAPTAIVRGRPFPDMILSAVIELRIEDVRQVAVLGDTGNDITSGIRAGAEIVAGTLTGAHDETHLRAAGATHIVESVRQFGDLLTH
ncbi:phosphonatase-like hydrolase [Gordonia sp. SID5947]|uniref:phosphonatase-like hydrolase n=1 Tax=Gordonia sp. SID5947 TaxID=2690315 RepID=UPI00136ACFFA|nr:phosphonatase-like hydrolase [Gordonia sp. SID5947]MYR06535.1 phosphonatase-like hydrolase [Gordonia sp. SID5947]